MRRNHLAVVLVAVSAVLFAPKAGAQLIPSPDGMTVYDVTLKVSWLANANFAATDAGKFGIGTINPKGSMDYATALEWVDSLNSQNGGAGFLGHNTWTLPTQTVFPEKDPSCSATGPAPFRDSFGFGCTASDMGSLFNVSFQIPYPNTAVPIPDIPVGPFHNFQPYLYWTRTGDVKGNGRHTFSFNSGWAGSNVGKHYMYVLPMIKGQVPGTYSLAGIGSLMVRSDGKLVYDPITQVTWLADADLAKTEWFSVQCQHPDGTLCIALDGSMQDSTADKWIVGMNSNGGYLGQANWELPNDPGRCGNFGCGDSPLGNLYYNQLGLSQGTPVVDAPDIDVHGFHHLQPYLYWACGAPATNPPCQYAIPDTGFAGSFSFGNGFQGTDLQINNLYATAYFPESPADALHEDIQQALASSPELNAFLSQADDISSAPNDHAKAGKLEAFIHHVNAQRGKALTSAEADALIALARAV